MGEPNQNDTDVLRRILNEVNLPSKVIRSKGFANRLKEFLQNEMKSDAQPYNADDRRKIVMLRKRGGSVKSIQKKYRKATKDMIDRWTSEIENEESEDGRKPDGEPVTTVTSNTLVVPTENFKVPFPVPSGENGLDVILPKKNDVSNEDNDGSANKSDIPDEVMEDGAASNSTDDDDNDEYYYTLDFADDSDDFVKKKQVDIPVETKKQIVKYWKDGCDGRNKTLKQVQHKYDKVNSINTLRNWEKLLADGFGGVREKRRQINQHVWDQFSAAKSETVYNEDLIRWAKEKAAELELNDFKASYEWLRTWKKKYEVENKDLATPLEDLYTDRETRSQSHCK